MDGAGGNNSGGVGSAEQQGDYDDEPVLKYQRMGADVGRLLGAAGAAGETGKDDGGGEKETVVRMAVHDTCLVRFLRFGFV